MELFVLVLWVFPVFIAFARGHKNAIPISILTVFGVLGVPYVVALIWSFSSNVKKERPLKMKDWQMLVIYILLLVIFAVIFINLFSL
jgi:hypothetical protein